MGLTTATLTAATCARAAAATTVRHRLCAYAVGVQAECEGCVCVFTRRANGVVWNRDHLRALIGANADFAVHAGAEQAICVVERDEHWKHRDVLLHDSRWLDLLHRAVECPVRKGVYEHHGVLSNPDLPDFGFTDECARTNFGEVCHRGDYRAGTHTA